MVTRIIELVTYSSFPCTLCDLLHAEGEEKPYAVIRTLRNAKMDSFSPLTEAGIKRSVKGIFNVVKDKKWLDKDDIDLALRELSEQYTHAKYHLVYAGSVSE